MPVQLSPSATMNTQVCLLFYNNTKQSNNSHCLNILATPADEINSINFELSQIEAELQKLRDRKQVLTQRKQKLLDDAQLKKSLNVNKKDWEKETFTWSKDLKKVMKDVFKINSLRPLQLSAMNAVLSKEDVILVMPTGGGKSLCYQLPAVISKNKGVTIVVSPLIALMEDQLNGLHQLNVRV